MAIPVLYRPAATVLKDLRLVVDGITLGGTDEQGTEWCVTGLGGWWESPPPRLALSERPQAHGASDGPTYFGARVINIEGYATSPDLATHLRARRIIASVCADPSVLHTLVVTQPGQPTMQCGVRISAPSRAADVSDRMCRYQVQLTAPDPRLYSATETVINLSVPAAPTGGLLLPFTVPFTIDGVSSSVGTGSALNEGTIATLPTVTFTGALTNPSITNVTTGRTVSLTYNLASGTLVLNFDKRSILLDGTASRASALKAGSAWWQIEPGANEIQFLAAGGGGTCELRYRSAWL